MSSPIRLSECADCFESLDCEQTAICRFIGAFATVIALIRTLHLGPLSSI